MNLMCKIKGHSWIKLNEIERKCSRCKKKQYGHDYYRHSGGEIEYMGMIWNDDKRDVNYKDNPFY